MTDAIKITVIGTGRVDAPKAAPAPAPTMMNRMKYDTQTMQNAGRTPGAGGFSGRTTTVTGGLHNTPGGMTRPSGIQTNPAPSFSGIQRPRQPESTVKQVEINIPDFLKNSKR